MAGSNLKNSFPKNDNGANGVGSYTLLADRLQASGLYSSEEDVSKNFDSLVGELRSWIEDNSCPRNEALLDLLLKEKSGGKEFRRDGMPNASHEVLQAIMFIRDLEDGMQVDDPDRVLSLILSHDMGEDFGYWPKDLRKYLVDNGVPEDQETHEFIDEFTITSFHFRDDDGKKIENYKNKADFIYTIHGNKNTSIAKFYDNIHNVNTAIFGFSNEIKALRYIATIETLLPPDKLQNLTKMHPSQEKAYLGLNHMLTQACRPVLNWVAGDVGQNINITPQNKINGQTLLPSGLDTPEIGRTRMQKALSGYVSLFAPSEDLSADNDAAPV
ncbi:MAG: hypothetical protein ACRBDI_06990 [Alphaproteobacteria bacterium]